MYSFPELGFMRVDGVLPSSWTFYNGSYPLVNAFYAVMRPDEPEDAFPYYWYYRELKYYYLSPEGNPPGVMNSRYG